MSLCFFFFQAEDGIRDDLVTGVQTCALPIFHCAGTGRVRSTESTVLHVLRAVEEEGMRMRTAEATVHVPTAVALYLLNHKRDALQRIEARYGLHVTITADDALIPPAHRIDRIKVKDGTAAAAPSGRPLPPTPVRRDTLHGAAAVAPSFQPPDSDEDKHAPARGPPGRAPGRGGPPESPGRQSRKPPPRPPPPPGARR